MKYGLMVFSLFCYLVTVWLYGTELFNLSRRTFQRKYSEMNLSISTVSPSYALSDKTTTQSEQPVELQAEIHIDNEEFQANVDFRLPFDIDDTTSMRNEHPEVVCMPEIFGYSKDQGDQVFPPFEYPDCAEKLNGPVAQISINYEEDTLNIRCPFKVKPTYVTLDSKFDPKKLYLQYEMKDHWNPQNTPKSLLPNEDFVFASCSDPPNFNSVAYQPRFNQTAHDRAEKIMKTLGGSDQTLTVLMLTVDSFSRRHFFRKLPKTVAFLNSLNANSNFSVFDFKLSNIQDSATVDNIVPIFGSTY